MMGCVNSRNQLEKIAAVPTIKGRCHRYHEAAGAATNAAFRWNKSQSILDRRKGQSFGQSPPATRSVWSFPQIWLFRLQRKRVVACDAVPLPAACMLEMKRCREDTQLTMDERLQSSNCTLNSMRNIHLHGYMEVIRLSCGQESEKTNQI